MAKTFGEVFEAYLDRAMKEGRFESFNDFAKQAKIDASNLRGHINTRFPPTKDTVERIAKALNLRAVDLLDGVMTPWGLPLCAPKSEARGQPSEPPRVTKRSAS